MRLGAFMALGAILVAACLAWSVAVYHDCRKIGLSSSTCTFLAVKL